MAIFSNQATLTYNGNSTDSNVAYGEILELLAVSKTAVDVDYTPGELLTYAVSLRNTGATALNGLTLTDDLGGYVFGGNTVYPLTAETESLRLIVNGVLQPAPAVTAGPPLTVSGINIPAGADAVLIYQARVNRFADPTEDGSIVNTVSVSGGGLTAPVTDSTTVPGSTAPELTITKSISPAQVADNDRVTYTFVIQNSGNEAVEEADDAAITDLFDPILTDLVVTFNGAAWTQGVQYTYDPVTGLFSTVPGLITIPAATYTRDDTTGEYTVTPGIATLTVTGTI